MATLSTALNDNVQTQLIQCYASLITDDGILNVEISKSQIQKGACFCGLFAIAYATQLAYGTAEISNIVFDQA